MNLDIQNEYIVLEVHQELESEETIPFIYINLRDIVASFRRLAFITNQSDRVDRAVKIFLVRVHVIQVFFTISNL